MNETRKTLGQLAVPIGLEILCAMLAGMVDTVMLSTVGDAAVGAVGTANTYLNLFIIMFSIISSGMTAVMTQYIGAGQPGVAVQARQVGLWFNGLLGTALSLLLCLGAQPIAAMAGVAPALRSHAVVYLRIVGGTCFLNALVPIFSSYLRAFGHTRPPMVAAVVSNLCNLVLNAVFLFVFRLGVPGVAMATALSKVINLVMVQLASRRLVRAADYPQRIDNRTVAGQILRIGLPSAMETALYNLSVAIIVRMLNQMDAQGLNVTARTYAMVVSNFSFCVAAAVSQANAILAGWRIGAGEFEQCSRATKRVAVLGILASAGTAAVFALFARPLIGLISTDAQLVSLVAKLLAVDILLEMGRAGNLVFGNALKASGDALFTTILGAVFMYLCAVGGGWLLGVRCGWMAVGIYMAMALDECVRAVCMGIRWHTGQWKEKCLVQQ